MKINVAVILNDLSGNPIKSGESDLTLREVCVNSLLMNKPNESVEGTEKLARYTLAQRINDSDVAELTVEELAKIKKLIAELYTTIVTGAAYAALEG